MQDLQSAAAAVISGSLAVAAARYFVIKAFERIEALPEKIADIKAQLSLIHFKLEKLERIQDSIQAHDVKLAALEARGSGRTVEKNSRK